MTPKTIRLARNLSHGQRVRVSETISLREPSWTSVVEGVVESCRAEPTGSWYAHGKNGRLWLTRILLRKDDGEITSLVLDDCTQIEVLSE